MDQRVNCPIPTPSSLPKASGIRLTILSLVLIPELALTGSSQFIHQQRFTSIGPVEVEQTVTATEDSVDPVATTKKLAALVPPDS